MIVACFRIAAMVLRQRPHIEGKGHLKNVPTPLIITLTHDSYYEVPSLSRVYFSLHPLPDFCILGKTEFLSGRYLATNFGKKSAILRYLLSLLDRTRLPEAVFKALRITTIHRPFIETYRKKKKRISTEISGQIDKINQGISRGLSTVVFPEGTTWGFGGLKKIRSIVYQLVETTRKEYHKRAYLLPINVKVDGLVKGKKDVFINVGKPVYFRAAKDAFNERLARILNRLHTITFSQIAAYYLTRLAERERDARVNRTIDRERLAQAIREITREISAEVRRRVLPYIDARLADHGYLDGKLERFIKYCRKKRYLLEARLDAGGTRFMLNIDSILSTYPEKVYRKLNPLGFYAHELGSLGEERIRAIFDRHLDLALRPAR
jgi:1-acyl-sn-glycerol-3-phosphate acyltransferase